MVNYARLKETLRLAGFAVSDGPIFTARDFGQYAKYLIQTPYRKSAGATANPSAPVNLAAIAYGIAFPTILPKQVAAQVGANITLSNVYLWPEAMNSSLEMLNGNHNPASNFVVGNGQNVQVAVSIRYNQDGVIPKSEDGYYKLPRVSPNNQKPWTFAFSFATMPNVSLDEYDITMSLSLDSTGADSPVLKYTLDGNTLVSDPAGSNITDSQGIEGQVVQNIERYSFNFIKDLLLPESMRAETVPYGKYTITLEAKGKDSGTQKGDSAKAVAKVEIL